MDPAERSDETLALALQSGDESAFDELVRRHQGRVFAVAYRITGNREDALDVAQDVFVKAYRKVHRWKPSGGFASWLTRLAVNQSIDALRRLKRHRHAPLDDAWNSNANSNDIEPRSDGTERQVEAREIGRRVDEALDALSESQRAVFAMRHYQGMQLSEIAEAMGCTVGSVKVHLFRAMKKLQVELGDLHQD